ncbi:hypothetical protein K0M31_002958 [Melipona bicolor]|uniref:Uncharacterized protein n=1 Tax=Melipona bicolor TaxID=60889 RepID=A0AA40G075_9HYME|nr:hypothetical protein K0M31_002958 [Melipona bicolor]
MLKRRTHISDVTGCYFPSETTPFNASLFRGAFRFGQDHDLAGHFDKRPEP